MALKEQQPKEIDIWKEHSSGIASVGVYISDEKGRLLLVQDIDEHGGKWSPIAGYIDDKDFEEPELAAIREAKEELGLDITLDKLIGVWHYQEENGKTHFGYAYTANINGGTFTPQTEEIQNWKFFYPEEIEELHTEGMLKTPQYNYKGFQLWQEKAFHPRSVVVSNGRRKEDRVIPSRAVLPARTMASS